MNTNIYEPMTYEEALAKVKAQIKERQDADAKRFEQLMQTFERSRKRPVEQVVPMSEETYNKTVAFLDKVEEILDMELEDKESEA